MSWLSKRLRHLGLLPPKNAKYSRKVDAAQAVYWEEPAARIPEARTNLPQAADPAPLSLKTALVSDWPADGAGLLAKWRERGGRGTPFVAEQRDALRAGVNAQWADWLERLAGAADDATGNVFDVLNAGPAYLGDPVDWCATFDGQTWMRGEYRWLKDHVYGSGFRNPFYVADVKIPWELNKHLHFPPLALAYWLTGREAYAETFVRHVDSWIEQHPPFRNAGWMECLIVAHRAISWSLALPAFLDSLNLTPAFAERMSIALARHGEFIAANYERNKVASNHFIGNLAGMLVLTLLHPELARAEAWETEARTCLLEEMDRQVLADGVQYEQSTSYHRYVYEFVLLSCTVARAVGRPLDERIEAATGAMGRALALQMLEDGETFRFGDADGARVLDVERADVNDYRWQLALGAALLNDGVLHTPGAEETITWRLWAPALGRDALPEPLERAGGALPVGGVVVLRQGDATVAVDGGNLGQPSARPHEPSATHGHDDLGSLCIAARGRRWLTDPASGSYTTHQHFHNLLRSAWGHNGILAAPAEAEEAAHVGPSLTLRRPWTYARRARPARLAAYTGDGTAPLSAAYVLVEGTFGDLGALRWHRWIVTAPDGGYVAWFDRVEGPRPLSLLVPLHWEPDLRLSIDGTTVEEGPAIPPLHRTLANGAVASVDDAAGRRAHVLSCGPGEADVSGYRGHRYPLRGWHAPDYGRIEPAPWLLVQRARVEPGAWLATVLSFEADAAVAAWDGTGAAAALQITSGGRTATWRVEVEPRAELSADVDGTAHRLRVGDVAAPIPPPVWAGTCTNAVRQPPPGHAPLTPDAG